MKKSFLILVLMISIILFIEEPVRSEFGSDLSLKLYCPYDGVIVKKQSQVIISLTFGQIALSGYANDIFIDIVKSDGNLLVDNANPYEFSAGIYRYNFTSRSIGFHKVYVYCQIFNSIRVATGFFRAKEDEYNYFLRFMERLNNNIVLEEMESEKFDNLTVKHLKAQDLNFEVILSLSKEQLEQQAVEDIAMESIFKVLVSILTIFFFAVCFSFYVRYVKRKKNIRRRKQI